MHEFYAKTTSCSRLGVTTSREYSFIFKINVVFDFSLLSKNGDKDAYYSRVFVVFYFTEYPDLQNTVPLIYKSSANNVLHMPE